MAAAEALKQPGPRPGGDPAADEATPRCPACGAALRDLARPRLLRCPRCGLCRRRPVQGRRDREELILHHREVDPHARVAQAKAVFYERALDTLGEAFPRRPRRLLDVGCGWGDFLERAMRRGWGASGVEILPEAVAAARRRLPGAQLHLGPFGAIPLSAGEVQAVTFWDVLDHVEDPATELAAAHSLLDRGGMVGIRIRNASVQLWLRRADRLVGALRRRPPRKRLHVLHRFAFTPAALLRLLARSGFEKIRIENAPLTAGDPYGHSLRVPPLPLLKAVGASAAGLLFAASGGKLLLSPSLLAWARKP